MSDNTYIFLKGGGEMGAVIRAYDWSKTSIGSPDTWPASLRITLSNLLSARFPIALYWGPEHIFFYNDAYGEMLTDGDVHTHLMGLPGRAARGELWDKFIGKTISEILDGGHSTWAEDQLVPIHRNGKTEDRYWTFSYSPVSDEHGVRMGVQLIAKETTKRVAALQQLAESRQQYQFAIEAGELSIWDLNPATNRFTADERLKQWFGLHPDEEIPLSLAVENIEERDRPRVAEAIGRAMDYESGGRYDIEYAILPPGADQERMVRAKGRAYFDDNRVCYRFNGTLQDITAQVAARKALEESEARFRALIEEAPTATCLYLGRDLTIALANEAILNTWDKDASVIGKTVREALPELEGQGIFEMLDRVYATGQTFRDEASRADLLLNGVLTPQYFNYACKPLFDEGGQVYGIIASSVNVTEQVMIRQQVEASEAKLRGIVSTAPAAIALFVGRDLVIENPNQAFIDIVGKDWNITGKPLREAMPELEGQPFLKILDDVYTTGVPFTSSSTMVKVLREGMLTSRYYNVSYSPVYNAEGEIYAVLDVGIDVTEQIEARQEAETAQEALRNAIELAELGTFSVNMADGMITASPRVANWFGFDGLTAHTEGFISGVGESERDFVRSSLANAMRPGSDGRYNIVHSVNNAKTGRRIIIHALGKVYADNEGIPLRVEGTAQDITAQQNLQIALENEVQVRTEELAASNEELHATVEELAESNTQLIHSNDELAQYAYVASHDLQEPLRKIRVFTGMLGSNSELPEKARPTVEKISSSAERMSLLIQDLLSFSRLLKSDTLMRPVPLAETVAAVWDDFELVVQEKGATIEIGELPEIQAVNLQMNQLFYNLISNALKFTIPDRRPQIQVMAHPITQDEVKQYISKPLDFSTYYHITIEDNGIGFETQYHEQIFEVFKRLHGRDHYQGSGIGLALCRRIVNNHNGYLYATSEKDKGSTFHLILPDKQTNSVSQFADDEPMLFPDVN